MSQFFHRLIMSLNLLMFKEVDSQEQPAEGVRDGEVILGDKVWGGHTHVMIEVVVRQQIIQMPGDLLRIAYLYQVSVHTLLNLERNATGSIGDYRFPFHERLRHLHLESFFMRKLQRNGAFSQQGIEQLIQVKVTEALMKGKPVIAYRA